MSPKTRKSPKIAASGTLFGASHFAIHSLEGRNALLLSIAKKHGLSDLVYQAEFDQKNQVSRFVFRLAESKNIQSCLTRLDQIATTFTVLVGDPAKRNEVDDLIVAMGKKQVLDSVEVAQLTAARLAEQRA